MKTETVALEKIFSKKKWSVPMVTLDKHVGEMDKMELKETTMNIENRRLKQMTLDDADKMARIFNKLMGSSVAPRKEFIEQNAHRANIDI